MNNIKDEKFDLEAIDKTFVNYKSKQILKGKIVLLKTDGAVFNLGGKIDAFIPIEEFSNFQNAKVGDEFEVLLEGSKNDDGMMLASKNKAEGILIANKKAEKIKIGEKFTFFVDKIYNNNLLGRLGVYEIIVPNNEISINQNKHYGKLLKKQIEVIAIEISNKRIIASIIALEKQKQEILNNSFWPSLFINKKVIGTVKKILPYGAFVDVEGVDCFVHISNLSYDRVQSPEEVLKIGQTLEFRIINFDKDNKKIELGLKQNFENPIIKKLKNLQVGEYYKGKVVKLLPFGAIVRLENNLEGLLHISDVANVSGKRIYEIVKLDDEITIMVKNIDVEARKISFMFNPQKSI